MGRIKGLVLALMIVAVAAFLGVSQVKAAELYGACPIGTAGTLKAFSPSTDDFYYKVAYEVYSNSAGASSIVSPIAVKLGADLNLNDTLNFILNNAQFNPDQTVYYVLLADNSSAGSTNYPDVLGLVGKTIRMDNLTTASSASVGYYIAAITSSTISSPTPNIALRVDNASSTGTDSGHYLYLAQVVEGTGPGNYTVKDIGSGVYVEPNLDASCDNNPQILINFTAPNESVDNKVFAEILPKCGNIAVGSGLLNLGAELNTDVDFTQFLGGSKVVNTTEIYTCGTGCGLSSCAACSGNCPTSGGGTTTTCDQYIVGTDLACSAIRGTVSFTLTSLAPESGITSVKYMNVDCTANSDKTAWTCSATNVALNNSSCLDIKVDGTTSLSPTSWTISNMSVTDVSGATNVCYAPTNGDAGAWYGGLEAMVPFVKSGDGYETYIKLFNRYDKDAKVFAATFKDGGSGSMMIALKQIATIPAGGEIQITGADIQQDFGLTADQIAYGIPVKFMIMVPSGKGCSGMAGTIDVDTLTGNTCPINPNDPYVEGIVVSVTPQGQRSIPLEFKYFKNGSYVQ